MLARSGPGGGDLVLLTRAAAALVAVMAAAAGCGDIGGGGAGGGDAADGPVSPRTGGTAVVAGASEIVSLQAFVPTGAMGEEVQKHVLFTTLVRLDSGLTPRPHLARSWELDDDSTAIVFHLRDDVRWSDGEPTTAADVAFTFRRARDPDVPFANRSYFARWDSVEVVDRWTVRFELEPHYGFLLGWSETAVMPEHVLGDVPPSELRTHPFGAAEAVTNGPFRIVEHQPQERWVFGANPDHPEELGGRPRLDRLVYRIVPEPSSRLAALRAGNVDLITDLPPEQAASVRGDPDLRLGSYPASAYTFVVWNTRLPLFREAAVRRALTMAMDRPAILRTVRHGFGTVASGPVGPWHWAYDSAWAPLPHDPDSARALLDGAGWRDADGDGVRERDGEPFTFELLTNPTQERRSIAVMIQSDLRGVGVEARVRVRESTALASALTRPPREFDAAVLGWQRDFVVDDRDLWACDAMDEPYQIAGFCDRALDAVLDSAATAAGRRERRRLLRRYHEFIARQQPYAFLYYLERVHARRTRLRGVAPDLRGDLVSAPAWWVADAGSR